MRTDLGVCIHGVVRSPLPRSNCEACERWRWWEPSHPIWEKRPEVWNEGTKVIWWDEPWSLMHWSTRLAASLVLCLIFSVVGFIIYISWWGHENPDPPPHCSTYADTRLSDLPSRCAKSFGVTDGIR